MSTIILPKLSFTNEKETIKAQIFCIQEASEPQITNGIFRKQTNTYLLLSQTSQLEIFALIRCRAASFGS
jgi:hypothetical protein